MGSQRNCCQTHNTSRSYDHSHVALDLLFERPVQKEVVQLLLLETMHKHFTSCVLVHGMGFKDLGSGVNGVTTQGFKCKFGENDMVNATKPWGDRFSARCVAPTDVNFKDAPGMEGTQPPQRPRATPAPPQLSTRATRRSSK